MSKSKRLWTLFISMLSISTFTFGGGFVIVTLMKRKFADELHWVDEQEMLDMTALAQSSPGAIAVNAAILMGWKVGGFAGMLTAVTATIIPPLVIIGVISFFYAAFSTNHYVALMLKGMQTGVAAVIFDVVLGLGNGVLKQKKILYTLLMILAFVLAFFIKINVIYIILGAACVGILTEIIQRQKKGGASA